MGFVNNESIMKIYQKTTLSSSWQYSNDGEQILASTIQTLATREKCRLLAETMAIWSWLSFVRLVTSLEMDVSLIYHLRLVYISFGGRKWRQNTRGTAIGTRSVIKGDSFGLSFYVSRSFLCIDSHVLGRCLIAARWQVSVEWGAACIAAQHNSFGC